MSVGVKKGKSTSEHRRGDSCRPNSAATVVVLWNTNWDIPSWNAWQSTAGIGVTTDGKFVEANQTERSADTSTPISLLLSL